MAAVEAEFPQSLGRKKVQVWDTAMDLKYRAGPIRQFFFKKEVLELANTNLPGS